MKLLNKLFFGLNSAVDEAQETKLLRISNKGLVLSLLLNIAILIIAFTFDVIHQTLSFETILIAVMLIIVSGYISILLNKSDVLTYETYSKEEFKLAIKKLKIKMLIQVAFAFVVFTTIFVFGSAYILNEPISFIDLTISIIICLIYGLGMYAWQKSKIKKEF